MSGPWDSGGSGAEQLENDHVGAIGTVLSKKRPATADDDPTRSVKSPRTENHYPSLDHGENEASSPDSEVLIDMADDTTFQQYQIDGPNLPSTASGWGDSRSTAADPYDISALLRDNARLQAENAELRERCSAAEGPLPYPVLYRIKCVNDDTTYTFRDRPIIIEDGTYDHQHFESLRRVPNETAWEESQNDAPFVVYKSYSCGTRVAKRKGSNTTAATEEVHVLDETLQQTLQNLFKSHPGLEIYHNSGVFANNNTLTEPHVWLAHFEDEIATFLTSCTQDRTNPLRELLKYLESQSHDMRRKAANHFAQGLVTSDLMPYLFKPGDLLVSKDDDEVVVSKQISVVNGPSTIGHDALWECQGAALVFDGKFHSNHLDFRPKVSRRLKSPTRIDSLAVYPMKFLDAASKELLLTRGRRFFWCRCQQYVTCIVSQGQTEKELTEVRYMVDVKAYYMLHDDEKVKDSEAEDIRPEDEDFILRLPPTIQGFRMSDKCWVQLRVDDIRPVVWNKQAFKDLVIADDDDGDTKQLIQALVQNKIQFDEGIDFVDGKGTGLVLLLHGAPGTGKTLTAESVAEIAERPLYRVTCGDVGTSPVQVEEYLESVFTLGRRWGCVVLLDKADVFLEERSLDNLERNALVSVFLRAVEYYDAILILTSNRVGQFNEAFKSRVQLALPYRPLTIAQRIAIWTNSIHRLQSVNESMNIEEILPQIEALAKTQMNGRQIRNAINTARQLARFQKLTPTLKDLKRAINVSQRFDRYIDEIRDGQTEEEIARHKGDR